MAIWFESYYSTNTYFSQWGDMIVNGVEKGFHTYMIAINLQNTVDGINNEILKEKKCNE